MRINCIAVIGKQNNPLYLRNFDGTPDDLKYHYIAHTSCDVIEEKISGGAKTPDMFLGLLQTVGDLAVYGYITNTHIKFIVVITIPEIIVKDIDMRNIFRDVHAAFIALASNPFYEIDTTKPVVSRNFNSFIEMIGKRDY
ncbi:hypothetical protein IWQ62_003835 [Dispira parvispora]|uniref:Trafficking protein particle complex subunit 2-like protein n=1 Tax=Dispira parvispora TaxID=1520584 RepID=A0A9W8E196_9FUNG|nr:hypothetical protein IWQ62_003835 [Dispira parvispora]